MDNNTNNSINSNIKKDLDIKTIAENYILSVSLARSSNTAKTYLNGINIFLQSLIKNGIDPENDKVSTLSEEAIIPFLSYIKGYSPATERLYITAVTGFFEYIISERLAEINLPRVRLLIKQRARRPGQRLPQFNKDSIESVINYVENLKNKPCEEKSDRLINLRDRAFLITLADTGLRVHEACNLRRGDIDWNEGKAIIIGKGDKQAVVRFSRRAQDAMSDYLRERSELDGNSGRALSSMPVFARHDRGSGSKIKPMTTTTGRNIVSTRVMDALGPDAVGTITPHSFRHYFVTRVLQGSGNLKLAQALARHKNIAVTQRYAHLTDNELDRGYWEIFEEK